MTVFKKTVLVTIAAFLLITVTVSAQNPTHLKWREYESDNFMVYYPEGQEMTAYRALYVAEQVHKPLSEMYGPVDSKITIVVRDEEDYAEGGAYFYDNKIEISATGMDYGFRSYTDWLWNVVTHELTHVYSIHQSMKAPRMIPMAYYQHIDYQEERRDDVLVGYPNQMISYPIPMFNIPAWLAEGVAQYQSRSVHFDRWDAHRDMIVRQAFLHDKLMKVDEISVFAWTGRQNEMVYNHGYSLVRYISETYGNEKVVELMRELSSKTSITFDIVCRRVLDMSQDELYDEWVDSLDKRYTALQDTLGTLAEGEVFRKGGFLNGFPTWSPDGSKLAYVSNKGQDYSLTACFVANLSDDGWQWEGKEKQEKNITKKIKEIRQDSDDKEDIEDALNILKGSFDIALAPGIQSAPLWLDEWNLLYNRRMPSDKHGSHWWDMYRYVINREDPREGEKTRITHNLRGTYPDLSPDKRYMAYVQNGSGLNNLYIMDRNDNSIKPVTDFTDGTFIYRPRWSPDGKRIAFTIHQGDQVNIAVINRDGSGFRYLVSSEGQDRDPAWSSDGRFLYFSSDLTGIANIYRLDCTDSSVCQITNVIGGAYSPAPSPADTTLAFSHYGPDGYEIRFISKHATFDNENSGLFHKHVEYNPAAFKTIFDPGNSKRHTMRTDSFTLMPLVNNDRGNMKIGTYLTNTEITDQASFVAMGSIAPTNRESDLFAVFEYRNFIPTVFVEMYRMTRSAEEDENYMEKDGIVIRKRTYDLNEIDFGLRYNYHDAHRFEGRLIYSRYNAKLEYTNYLTGQQINKPYYTYSKGFDLALSYDFDKHIRARDEEINPRGGRKIRARFDRYRDNFLDDFEYVGFLREKYIIYNYNRYFLNWIERLPVPFTEKHTLNLRTQFNIIDKYVDRFYENQLGGPRQMRGYTFYSLSGRKNLMFQALYRFPIMYDIRKQFLIWNFNHIYMGVFADIGRAWNKKSLNWSLNGFKRDAGVELRLDAISFYNFPTMIEFSAAYGPDDTWIRTYDETSSKVVTVKDKQDPWKFYLNILFGFI